MRKLTLLIVSIAVAMAVLLRTAVPGLTQEDNQPLETNVPNPSVSTAQPAIVIDSTLAEVGPYENIASADSALVKIGTEIFALQVNSKGFVATGVTFSYKSNACTGTAYVLSPASHSLYISYPKYDNGSGVLQYYGGGVAGTTLYYAEPKTSQTVTINSESIVASNGKSAVCYPLPATKESVNSVATTNISTLPFVAPFKLSF